MLDAGKDRTQRAVQNLVRLKLIKGVKHPSMAFNGKFYMRELGFEKAKYICVNRLSKIRDYLIHRALRNGVELTAVQVHEKTGLNINVVRQKLNKMSGNNEILAIKPQNNKNRVLYKQINHCSPEKAHFHNAFAALYYGAKKKRVSV